MKILFVGLGNLGSQVLDVFALRAKPGDHFLIGGRHLAYLQERANWTSAAALQLGISVTIDVTSMDVLNIEQTAQTISTFHPDVIFSSVTLFPSANISQLPPPYAEKLAHARGGPWLPTTLALVYKLMQAVRATGQDIIVLNGGTPDISHPVLEKVGLAPTSGIGNIALTVPPLKKAIAQQLQQPLEQVDVLFFAHTYVVQSLRKGTDGGAPFHLAVSVNGEDVSSQLDMPKLFERLPRTLEHEYTQLLTATSAVSVFEMLMSGTPRIVHTPGPRGLPGGYPIQAGSQGIEIVLPARFSLEEAIHINQEGQVFEGVERIDEDGTVLFAQKNMAYLKEVLGYECQRMPLSEVEAWAKELQARFVARASQS